MKNLFDKRDKIPSEIEKYIERRNIDRQTLINEVIINLRYTDAVFDSSINSIKALANYNHFSELELLYFLL